MKASITPPRSYRPGAWKWLFRCFCRQAPARHHIGGWRQRPAILAATRESGLGLRSKKRRITTSDTVAPSGSGAGFESEMCRARRSLGGAAYALRCQHLADHVHVLFESGNRGDQLVPLLDHLLMAANGCLERGRELRDLIVIDLVEIEQLLHLGEREPVILAAQDQLQPRQITACEQALLPLADRAQQPFRFIEPQRSRRDIELCAYSADLVRLGHGGIVQKRQAGSRLVMR